MQKRNNQNDQTLPPLSGSSDGSPLLIVCEQTGQQRVQMKMDELFNTSPNIPAIGEPVNFENEETLQLKKVTEKQASRKRRISTNSAAGRSRRMELEQTRESKPASRSINPFSSQTMKLAMFAVFASFFRA